jgi:probable HAF family extracellular repeat protein
MRLGRLIPAVALLLGACDSERIPTGSTSASLQAPLQTAQSEFAVIDLGTLGGSFSNAGQNGAINNAGQVVGSSATATGEIHAFLWHRGVMVDLGTPGEQSYAHAINEPAQVIGLKYYECGPGCFPWHGFLWERGVMTDLGMVPSAINDVGQIIGYDALGGKGFVWERGVKTDLGSLTLPLAINNAGQIVGSNSVATHAFLWERGVTTELGTLGGGLIQAAAINSRGQIVGNGNTATGEWHAFFWDHGVMTDLGTLGGTSTSVEPGDIIPGGINDLGQVAGASQTATGESHAFLWDQGVMTDLGKPLGTTGSVGWVMNNAGEMIGTFEQDANDHVFVWAKGVMTGLPALGGAAGSWPAGINNVGQIAGSSGGHAVLWERRPRANAGR